MRLYLFPVDFHFLHTFSDADDTTSSEDTIATGEPFLTVTILNIFSKLRELRVLNIIFHLSEVIASSFK